MRIITVFFSMKGETIAPGMKIVNLEKGIPTSPPSSLLASQLYRSGRLVRSRNLTSGL